VSNTELNDKRCPQCDCMLYTVAIGADGEPAKIECNMCGAAFPANVPRVLSLREAGLLSELIHGVDRNLKLRYYQFGTRDADHPLVVMMRAFTYDGGGFINETDDIRDVYVWCSGFTERWLKVSDILTALDNLDGKHGDTNPIATIEEDK